MPLKRTYFDVYLDDPDTPGEVIHHRTEVRGVDELRAELEGKAHGISLKDSMHQTYLWAWASLVRQGLYSGKWPEFKLAAIQVRADDEKTVDVDPTRPGAVTD